MDFFYNSLDNLGGEKIYLPSDFHFTDFYQHYGSVHLLCEYRNFLFSTRITSGHNQPLSFFINCPTPLLFDKLGFYCAFIIDNNKHSSKTGAYADSILFSSSNRDEFFKMLFDYIADTGFIATSDKYLGWCILYSYELSGLYSQYPYHGYYTYDSFGSDLSYSPLPCCYPDFAPIVQILGGTPSSDQLTNLKSICQLLGVDTSQGGLFGCELMKEYLKRLVLNFGNTPSTQPNDNLKSICYFLGVDTSENGLSGCDLSKDYVKRDGIMLGAVYA